MMKAITAAKATGSQGAPCGTMPSVRVLSTAYSAGMASGRAVRGSTGAWPPTKPWLRSGASSRGDGSSACGIFIIIAST